MAGVIRNPGFGISGTAIRYKSKAELAKAKLFVEGEFMDDKKTEDMLSHVQALRGERQDLKLPDEGNPALPVPTPDVAQPPVAPPLAVQTPVVQAPPLAPAPVQFVQPPVYVAPQPPAQPTWTPPSQMGLTQEQSFFLMNSGLGLTPQQQQWLSMGYGVQQVLSHQQMMALGLLPQAPTMPVGPPQIPTTQAHSSGLFQQFQSQVSEAKVGSFDYIDQKKTSIKFGIIGAGQGGSRIAEAFHILGYPTCVVNTASHDLQNINIPEENKLLLKTGAGGAGKDLQEGLDAASDYAEDILDLMKNTFPRDVEHIMVCCGGGGGSGSGGLPKVIDMARVMNVPVGVIFTLPKDSEGSKVKENAFSRILMLDKKLAAGEIAPLILIDNNKIHEMHVGVSLAKFWRLANAQIAGLFHLFNVLSAQNSAYSSFDPADYKTIIKSKGCMIFGSTTVDDISRNSAIAKALRDNVSKGLLAEGFDLTLSNIAGVIITGSQEMMENLPQESVDAAVECLERVVGGGTLHHGVYVENVDKLTVYTIIGGLHLPEERIKKLVKAV